MGDGELKGWTVAVLGGDLRMLEHMRLARLAGAKVQHYGLIPGAEVAAGQPQAASLVDAVKGARIISCPIPGLGADDELYAKFTSEKLRLTTEVLKGAAAGAMLLTCYSTPRMDEWAKATSVEIIPYGDDDALAILHAVPTAEGAIRIAIENTDDTLLGMNVLCLGLGRVGISVAQAFEGMKSRVLARRAQSGPIGACLGHERDPDRVARSQIAYREFRPDREFDIGPRPGQGFACTDASRCCDH